MSYKQYHFEQSDKTMFPCNLISTGTKTVVDHFSINKKKTKDINRNTVL